jgi:hypothetical protein
LAVVLTVPPAVLILAGVPLVSDIVLAGPSALRAELDELRLLGRSYSRRPRVSAAGIEVVATRKGDAVICALCRRLVEAGHDPALPLEVYRGATLALRVRSIGKAAGLTVNETGSGPKLVPFHKAPGGAGIGGFEADGEGTPMSDSGATEITRPAAASCSRLDEV